VTTERSDQWLVTRRAILHVLVPAAVVMAGILMLAFVSGVHVSELLQDTTNVLDGQWYVGMFSIFGIAIWGACAAICLLVLASTDDPGQNKVLIAGSVISLLFAVDDALLIHEIFPGRRELVVFAIYGLVSGALLWWAREEIKSSPNLGVLVVAIALLGASVVLDFGRQAGIWSGRIPTTMGGISKYLGAIMWLTYFAGTCRRIIRSQDRRELAH
jgi:hypothetical protein